MSAVSDLIGADTLMLSGIAYELDLPLDQGSPSGTAPATCVTKTPGQLAFTTTPEQFGLPLTNPITFSGTPTPDGTGVNWSVDSGKISASYMGYTITRIHGSLVTSVASSQPTLGLTCSGGVTRLFRAVLTASSMDHSIDVEIDVLGGQTAKAALQFTADVGEAVPASFFTVGISADRWQTDGCGGRYQLFTPPSTPLLLTALIENALTTGTIISTKFNWTVKGSAHVVANLGASVQLSLDGPGNVFVNVLVTVATNLDSAGTAIGQFSFAVVTEEELGLLRGLCILRQTYRFIPERIPIGDPAWRDRLEGNIASQPLNATELGRVQVAAQRIIETASAVLKRADAVVRAQAVTVARVRVK